LILDSPFYLSLSVSELGAPIYGMNHAFSSFVSKFGVTSNRLHVFPIRDMHLCSITASSVRNEPWLHHPFEEMLLKEIVVDP